jgi:OmpA-OmpF porin, OOP family
MKKLLILSAFTCFFVCGQAQILKKITDKAKEKMDTKVDKKIDDAANGKKDEKTTLESKESKDTTGTPAATNSQPASLKTYSKFDFVPGEKVIGFEDFSTGNIGDFPGGWNTNSSGEIVTVEGKQGRWLWLSKPGEFIPELSKTYPDDFTFEFDLLHGVPFAGGWISFALIELTDFENLQGWNTSPNFFRVGLYTATSGESSGSIEMDVRKAYSSQSANQFETGQLNDKNNPVHISVWRQKERVRVYVNEEKVLDVPKALASNAKLNSFLIYAKEADEEHKYFFGNLRLAVGAPDTRKKMLEQNKWVTHGILFDVNSDKIKPESYGTLKEMATVLKEFADLKVKIVGHTDADGNDASNLDLSKRRAASVKVALSKEFGIDESRMQTDGKGEGEPIDKNDNPAGKANNRRVEFIKI